MSVDESPDRVAAQLTNLGYQPALDGLRAIGITAFVLGHAGLMADQPQLIPFAWWMGVDMFFVISGFLITTLLLRERARTKRINLKAFYARRVSRLYPLIVAVIAIAIGQRLIRPDSNATPSWSSIVSMAFYYSNFQQLANPPDMYTAWGPLWSLAIEEQFYLLWPITLVLLLGRSFRLVRSIVFVSGLAVAMWIWRTYSWLSVTTSGNDFATLAGAWQTFYFSSFHRPDGLFLGCAAALLLAMADTPWVKVLIGWIHRLRYVAVVGVVILAVAAAVDGHSGWQVCWGLSLFNVLITGIIVDLVADRSSVLAKLLSFRPMLWLGHRTYALYVFHLGLLMVVVHGLGHSSLPWIFAACVLIAVVAGISYRFYEDPIRRWG
ncbi:MAG TPA: acyltransferase, partial [Acidimicrobiales bacterium]|nr:acyltransferase [Acidimicrobiales bacterium]